MQPHSCTPTISLTETTMENHRKKSSSGEIFSFPSTPNQDQDSDFEFGCLTPDSPSQDPSTNSPADHLFFNGRLLPHPFPCQQQPIVGLSRAASRTSSVSSKDSLRSSRSNSTNSRSSSCSSARTSSSSDNSERKLLYYNKLAHKATATTVSKMVTAQLYGSSQRWQYLTPVPALKRDVSQRKNGGSLVKENDKRSKRHGEKKKKQKNYERRAGICRRFFISFLFACRECHAMEPSTKDDSLQGDMKL